MRSNVFLLGICWLTFAGTATAQPAAKETASSTAIMPGMDEDIEIMRHIVNRALLDRWSSLFGVNLEVLTVPAPSGNVPAPPPGMSAPSSDVPAAVRASAGMSALHIYVASSLLNYRQQLAQGTGLSTGLEGTYLNGYGVVFTMTLPPVTNPGPRLRKVEKKTTDEWERVRAELRGRKTQTQPAQQPDAGPTLADVLLKVLAENGRHFGKLAADEKLTIVVTFRPHAGRAQPASASPKVYDRVELAPALRDNITLGDLNLRQARYSDAVAAFDKALKNLSGADVARLGSPELFRKLAQAHLGAGNVAEARKWLDLSEKIVRNRIIPVAAASPLPSRLAITVTKALLDRVGSGKMSFEEFRRAATINNQPAAKKADTP